MIPAAMVLTLAAVLVPALCDYRGPVCDVKDYGASDDGHQVNTAQIQAAIDDCSSKQGTVLLKNYSTGVFMSGALFLKSNIVFHIAESTTLLGSPSKTNTTWPQVYTRVGGTMQFGHASLLNGARCSSFNNSITVGDKCLEWNKLRNVTLTGRGTLNGNGASGWYDKPYFADRPTLLGLLWIDGLTITELFVTNPPFWTVHPTFCRNVYIADLNILTTGPNTDGIDPDSCEHVLIERCTISTGDDCIAIKSGKDADGRAVGIPTNNVTVRDMVFGRGHGISIGSETSGNVTNILLNNLTLDGTERGVRIKSQAGRGGIVANITYANMKIDNVQEAVSISMLYSSSASGVPPVFTNISVLNLTSAHVSKAGEIMCLADSPCTNVLLSNVTVTDYHDAYSCQNAHVTTGVPNMCPLLCVSSFVGAELVSPVPCS